MCCFSMTRQPPRSTRTYTLFPDSTLCVARLIATAARMLAPGGVLVFCTCSLEPAEVVERVESALAAGTALRRQPIRPEEVGGLAELVTEQGDLRSRPDQLANLGGIDGFYACRLVRS